MLPDNRTNTQPAAVTSNTQNTESVSLRPMDVVVVLVSHWPWILLSVLLSWCVAEFVLQTARPIYTRRASILIKDLNKGHSLGTQAAAFSDAGLFANTTDLNNEIFLLKSPSVMTETIQRLKLQMDYEVDGRFHAGTLYGSSLPVEVNLLDVTDADNVSMTLRIVNDSTYRLSQIRQGGISFSDELTGHLDRVIKTPIGRVNVIPQEGRFYVPERDIKITHMTLQQALSHYASQLSVTSKDNSSIINLTFDDFNQQRAEDILYCIIAIYNEQWMLDRNQVSISTNQFINERLQVIESELGNVETDISSYKSEHLIIGTAESAAGTYMGQVMSASSQLIDLNNQLYLARSVRSYLTNEQNFYQLLPVSQGFQNASVASQISTYNDLLLRRNNLLSASSLQNPLVQDFDVRLADLRRTLLASIDNNITEINQQIQSTQQVQAASTNKVASAPGQSRYLLSFERQQKVKESLYLFLLQKREENELSQAFTAYNNRVVTPPSGSNKPTSPVPSNIYMIFIAIGFLLPIILLILRELVNTSVRGRKDLDCLTIPFLGEIPLSTKENHLKRWIKSIKHIFGNTSRNQREDKTLHLLVKAGKTDVINEAFRVVRTNLEFVAGRQDKCHTILLTSFNPNSGKTFVVSNLSLALALKGKKVLVIDMDMRKRSLSALVGKHSQGLSNYLAGHVDDVHTLIKPSPMHESLDVLPAGKIPPNPTELLYEELLDAMMQVLRQEYDYIFLDCPPLEIVADASIVTRLSDMSLFIIRAEALQRSALPDVQKLYDQQRLPKMTILLNGTTDAFSRYGYHRYGSRYGYSYGYGNHYSSYGYSDEDRKSHDVES